MYGEYTALFTHSTQRTCTVSYIIFHCTMYILVVSYTLCKNKCAVCTFFSVYITYSRLSLVLTLSFSLHCLSFSFSLTLFLSLTISFSLTLLLYLSLSLSFSLSLSLCLSFYSYLISFPLFRRISPIICYLYSYSIKHLSSR